MDTEIINSIQNHFYQKKGLQCTKDPGLETVAMGQQFFHTPYFCVHSQMAWLGYFTAILPTTFSPRPGIKLKAKLHLLEEPYKDAQIPIALWVQIQLGTVSPLSMLSCA